MAFPKIVPLLYIALLYSHTLFANGMVPESTVLLVNESEQGGSMNIKNTDAKASLLYTKVINLPDDMETGLMVTQPVIRVEPGMTQTVNFILTNDIPLVTEHLKRVVFEGIPPVNTTTHSIQINISQNLPVIIHPKSLPIVYDAWKFLEWHLNGNLLQVKNPSKYVVRLDGNIKLLPSGRKGNLGKKYILPNQTIHIKINGNINTDKEVTFSPASRHGIQVKDFTSTLQ
jgi:P pilus assembly chaperone PapD